MDAYIKCCGGTTSVVLSISHNCESNEVTFDIVASDIPGGSALFALQIFLEGNWGDTEESITLENGNNNLGPLPFDLGNGTYLFRLRSGAIISNEFELVVDCPPLPGVAIASITTNCAEGLLEIIVNTTDLPGGTADFIFEYTDDNGATWSPVNGVPMTLVDGANNIDQAYTFPNGPYEFRLISVDETILSNNEPGLLVDCCEEPHITLVGGSTDCLGTGEGDPSVIQRTNVSIEYCGLPVPNDVRFEYFDGIDWIQFASAGNTGLASDENIFMQEQGNDLVVPAGVKQVRARDTVSGLSGSSTIEFIDCP